VEEPMTDVLTPEQRSRNMAAIRSRNTTPELRVRRALHVLGYRYRLHRSDLPGKPDIVLPKYRTVIFIHGCFWHMHDCPMGHPKPATNAAFWAEKRGRNAERDKEHTALLHRNGWTVYTVWECETRSAEKLSRAIGIIDGRLRGTKRFA
jgi:DNA mismatch endonuclease (patch repair protein)